MNDHPLVSIIIPTKNSANTIEKSLKSILAQTHDNYEIIIVDNYSSDNTIKLASKYTNKIYVVGNERTSQVNYGIKHAVGKYIYEVGSDFILEPNVVEEAVYACERNNLDAVLIHNTSDPSISFWAKVRKFERDMYIDDDLNVAVRFIKKEVLDKIGYFDESMVAAEDYDLHNRLVAAGYKIGRIDAKEIHIGEPKSIIEIAKKHYYYGKTLLAFIKKNKEKGIKQLSPLRPSYTKHWKEFVKHPVLTIGFIIYQVVRYSSGIIGYIVASVMEMRYENRE